jgi:autotransporter translocation and assembly factor TamB
MEINWSAIIAWLLQAIAASGLAILGFIGLTTTAIGQRLLGHYLDRRLAESKHSSEDRGAPGPLLVLGNAATEALRLAVRAGVLARLDRRAD